MFELCLVWPQQITRGEGPVEQRYLTIGHPMTGHPMT